MNLVKNHKSIREVLAVLACEVTRWWATESASGPTDGSVQGNEVPIGSSRQPLRSQCRCAQLQILGLHLV
ncbi:UNVERIFIED_CONTAM: hypothetical protein Slati_3761900 [Sesamum latifolium]|uniref:Uncharacterized protein n=1 Tax=Sesamum latifolium TaxID=2727402 RepID=A0AAW2U4W4_9LAMI